VTALAASNPRIRRLRRLSGRRSARHDERAFVLEGPTLVAEAVALGVALDEVFVEESCHDDVVSAAQAAGVRITTVEAGVLSGITDAVAPRPILAVAPLAPIDHDAVLRAAVDAGRPVLLLVEVGDPGNLGTILRAAEASGCAGVLCSPGTVDPWSPKTVRSSAGAVLHVPIAVGVDPSAALGDARALGVASAATVAHGGVAVDEIDLGGATLLVLGSEAHGLPADLLGTVDRSLTIPMEGRTESLNVAMAASVLVFEALRQRRAQRSAVGASEGARLMRPAAEPIGRLDPPATQ